MIPVTPLAAQSSYSDAFIAREAPVMSGKSAPIPSQKIFMPPPVPVDSTTGEAKPLRARELLGDGLGVREDRRGTDDLDLVARMRGACGERDGNGNGWDELHGRVSRHGWIRRLAS